MFSRSRGKGSPLFSAENWQMRGNTYQRGGIVLIILWLHLRSFQALLIIWWHLNWFAAKLESGPNEPVQPTWQAGGQVTPKEARHPGHGVPNPACYALHGASVLSQHTHPCAVPQRHTKATTTPLVLSYENKTFSNT